MSVDDTKYDENLFVSTCCKDFNYFNGNNIYCSRCGKIVKTLGENETIPIHVKFNTHTTDDYTNISGDVIKIFHKNAAKFAHDITCELINKTCPKCGNKTARYLRDQLDEIIYVCDKCRYVYGND